MSTFPEQLKYWKDAITKFLYRNPQYVDKPSVGYVRFLEHQHMIPKEAADALCLFAATKNFCAPETYVRVRRELLEKGIINQSRAQRELFQQMGEETRQHYGQDKRENPVYEDDEDDEDDEASDA